MRLKSIVKLGTMVSVLLFVLAVGYYVIMRLDMAERNRDADLFSFVPSDCVGVLDSDYIDVFLGNRQIFNYSQDLDAFHSTGLLKFLLGKLDEYATENGHGLSNQMNRLAVSFHNPSDSKNQVVYFRMGTADVQVLADILQEYAVSYFLPKEEVYRGETIYIYPLSTDDFLAVYADEGVFVVSYQKNLIEKVIDARLDETSLSHNELFMQMLDKKKGKDFLALYVRTPAMLLGGVEAEAWSDFNFHLNSDVLYLTGDTYVAGGLSCIDQLMDRIGEMEVVHESDLIVSSRKDSTELFVNAAFESNESGVGTLFNECVANLLADAPFVLVTDMEKVVGNPERFQDYLPSFVLRNATKLRRFILSVQLYVNHGRPSHIWVFTYKD